MGERYTHLGIEERCAIADLRAEGHSVRQIAATLDRPPPTIARELKRNGTKDGGYRATYAHEQARARRWCGARLDRDDELRKDVLSRLELGWSPEAVAGRLERERGKGVISHESIYRFIYAQIARTKDYSWRNLLRRGKWRRGHRRRGGSSSARTILRRRPLSERPAAVADRSEFGHWEADGMQFGRTGQTVLMLHERRSRLLIAVRRPSRAAAPVAKAMAAVLGPLPPEFRQTVTFDNGTEFAHHYELHAWGIETFFCDTYSPWQKGGVENAIGRMRWFLPRKTNLASLSEREFTGLLRVYNNTPRKCLGWQTPAEVLREQVLHFECEFTVWPVIPAEAGISQPLACRAERSAAKSRNLSGPAPLAPWERVTHFSARVRVPRCDTRPYRGSALPAYAGCMTIVPAAPIDCVYSSQPHPSTGPMGWATTFVFVGPLASLVAGSRPRPCKRPKPRRPRGPNGMLGLLVGRRPRGPEFGGGWPPWSGLRGPCLRRNDGSRRL